MALRSRLYVLLGMLGCVLTVLLRDSVAGITVVFAVLAIVVADLFLIIARLAEIRRRPVAFTIDSGRFMAISLHILGP